MYNKEIVPADIILLAVNDQKGVGYCSTATLDGERNSKPKIALKSLQKDYNKKGELGLIRDLKIGARCPPPSTSIYEFAAYLKLDNNEDEIQVGIQQSLFRGSKIENTEYMFGLVIYTGMQTKIMLNAGSYQFKKSKAEQLIGWFIII